MTKGGGEQGYGQGGRRQRCKWSCQLLQLESTSAARPIFASCCHINPALRHFSLNFNYFHSLARAFLQLINFFTLNFVYNCCWFALFVLFVLLQLVFALLLLLLLLWCLLGTQNSSFNWMDTTRSAGSLHCLTGAVRSICCTCLVLLLLLLVVLLLLLCCCCCRLRLRAIWVSSGGSCVINGQIKWKPSERGR